MRNSTRRGLTGAAIAILASATLALTAPPASADTTSCSIPPGNYGCSTRAIPANSIDHAVKMTVFSASGAAVTCRVHDAQNGIQVGILTNNNYYIAKSKTIYGLYGSYFLSCVRSISHGGGGGALTNGT